METALGLYATIATYLVDNHASDWWAPYLLAVAFGVPSYAVSVSPEERRPQRILGWLIGGPLFVSGGTLWCLVETGTELTQDVMLFGLAMNALFLMTNMVILILRTVPLFVAEPAVRYAFRVQPIGFIIVVTWSLAMLSVIAMYLSI
ncbi:hypothetical protein [Celeribacter ethanolicus]|uniref:Uncharacterized protein n=1 Tax=Celeribacter ethanolicus TaxID=1758178 RepID=A0A291G9N6_9RHOB|nr:hypothetical protein [Celeribacter ethanolicus]ATG46774.1 hypothetical protein CEW89_03890 [Celeribacter ethanolicus]TNE64652.1 MAG: hypothetical protein EP336_14840 [Paracoccaceae bacterium]